jgi:hypothetical protein
MQKSFLFRGGTTWKVVAACGLSPLFLAASAEAQTFAVSIGVRGTGSAAAIGANGGTTGGIEWINLDGLTLNATGQWQQFVFNFGTDPVTGFAGASANGVLDGTRGTLENIRIRNSSGYTDTVKLYLDNIVNTVGGTPETVTNFEAGDAFPAAVGSQHMFYQPRFSGSTQSFLLASPDIARVTDVSPQSGDQAYEFNMAFANASTSNWVRLTTFNHPNQGNPTIDFSPTSTLSFWLRAEVVPPSIVWTNTGGGSWTDPNNWTDGQVPNGVGAVANFLGGITSPSTVTINEPVTVNTVRLRNANSITFSGGETLFFNGTAQQPRNITVEEGNHTFTVPMEVLVSSGTSAFMNYSVSRAQDVLTVQSEIAINIIGGQTLTFQKQGLGRLDINNIETTDPVFQPTNILVSGGTMRLLPNSGRTRVNAVSIAGGTTPTAKFDITNNPVVVDYETTSPATTIRAQLASAYNGGAWDGNGITSSNANASQFGVGYAEASELTSVPAFFGTVDSTAMLMRLTRYGDTDLNGTVNLSDFNRLAANFGSTDAVWSQGDFNYDGLVNLSDFNRLAANFGLSAAGPEVTPEDWSNLAAAIPEPGSLAFVAAGALTLVRRQRRHGSRSV